jgi:hypothetical protein
LPDDREHYRQVSAHGARSKQSKIPHGVPIGIRKLLNPAFDKLFERVLYGYNTPQLLVFGPEADPRGIYRGNATLGNRRTPDVLPGIAEVVLLIQFNSIQFNSYEIQKLISRQRDESR